MENKTKKERNSSLEILRLCASLWVMYYHGLSLINRSECFTNGRIAVDFFFLLSGFFFLPSYNKENDKNCFEGLMSFLKKRFKPLMVTFCICMIFSIIYYVQFFEGIFNTSLWGYLWYVPHLMIVFAIYFLLRRIFKNPKIFNIIVGFLSFSCYFFILTYISNYGIVRGLAGIGFGILISQIPPLPEKLSKIFAPIMTIILFSIISTIAYLHIETQTEDIVCLLI